MKGTLHMTGPSTQREGHNRAGVCQLRAPFPALSRAARELLGTVGGAIEYQRWQPSSLAL